MAFRLSAVAQLEKVGAIASGERIDGPWPGTVRYVEITDGGAVPEPLRGKVTMMVVSPSRLVFSNPRGRTTWFELTAVVDAARTPDRDIMLLLAIGVAQTMVLTWRPTKSDTLGDPGRALWSRRDERLAALDTEQRCGVDLLAGLSFLRTARPDDARARLTAALASSEPYVVETARANLEQFGL